MLVDRPRSLKSFPQASSRDASPAEIASKAPAILLGQAGIVIAAALGLALVVQFIPAIGG
jgi:hypothetical protein